jgi:hypothetical protein
MVAVQEANRKYDDNVTPNMLIHDKFGIVTFRDVVDEIIGMSDRQQALDKIEEYDWFWDQFKSGSQGFSGKKTNNSMTYFNEFFTEEKDDELEIPVLENEEMWSSRVIDEYQSLEER